MLPKLRFALASLKGHARALSPIRVHRILPCILAILGASIFAGERAFASATETSTTLTLTSAGTQTSGVASNTVITLTATVTANRSPVTVGQVIFCNATALLCTDINLLGTAQLTAAGNATLRFVPGTGIHRYRAVFLGNAFDSPSKSSIQTLSVSAATTHAPSGNDAAMLPSPFVTPGASDLTLAPGATYTTGQLPSSTVTADFNGDGILDIATTTFDSLGTYVPGSVSIFLGKGDGTFSTAPAVVTGVFPCCLVTADLNGDGKPDLAFGNIVDGSISVLLGNGDGTFTEGASIPADFTTAGALAVGDFNNDGVEDLAISQEAAQKVQVLLGRGDGTFTPVSEEASTGFSPAGIAVGDFNGDGKMDLAVCNIFPEVGVEAPSSVTILLGNGDGTFKPAPSVPVGIAPEQILAADFNGDGKLDLAVLNIGLPTTLSMLFGNADGTFDSSSSQIPAGYFVGFALGDFNGDGKPDIGGFLEAWETAPQNVYALINNGDGTFASITASDPQIPNGGVAADFNGDGLADLAVVGQYGGLSIYLTTITGTSAPTGTATTTTLTCTPSTISIGGTSLFSAIVTSASGTPTGSVTFTDNGTMLGQSTLTDGAGTYPYTDLSTGNQTIVATYVPTGSFTASSGSCVLAVTGVQTNSSLTVSPTVAAQGDPVTLIASVSGDSGGRGSVPGDVTFYNGSNVIGSDINLAQGIATFTTTSLPAGIDYLTCTYNGSNVFAPSNCNIVPVTITSTSAAITLTSSLNPAPYLTSITFTAQVAPGSGGTIIFNVNGQNITTTPDAAGTATYTISSLTYGSYLITATWFATPSALGAEASLVQVVEYAPPPSDFSLTGTNVTMKIARAGTGQLELLSLNGFTGTVALTCDASALPGYLCAVKTPSVALTSGFSALIPYTLTPTYTTSSHPSHRSTRIALASLFPLSFFWMISLARKRHTLINKLLALLLLAILATATTACGPDHYIPIHIGTFPATFTGTGTSQSSTTPITHTVTINATITP